MKNVAHYSEVHKNDALGRRVQKQVVDQTAPGDVTKTFTRRYVYDGQEILLEYDEANHLLARYSHSGLRSDDVLGVEITSDGAVKKLAQTAGHYYYVKDAIGSVIDITNSSGEGLVPRIVETFG